MERECKFHGIVKFHEYKNGKIKCSKCVGEAVSRRQRRVKAILIEEAGGKCQRCGYDKYQGALQFHHKDRTTKEFNVQSGVTKALDKMRIEAAKCELVCANCHAEIEYELAYKEHLTKPRVYVRRRCHCGVRISANQKECGKCYKRKTKINWPSTEELVKMVEESNYSAVGRALGVTDNTVRKRIKNHPND